MSIFAKEFWRDVLVTIVGAIIAVCLTFGVKAWWDYRVEKGLVFRMVANAYNENQHNINIITTESKKGLLFNEELVRSQISIDLIEELYRNVTVHKYLDPQYTIQYIPSMYKEYRRILTTLKGSPVSEREIVDIIELLYSFEELLREIGHSIMNDKKWEEYSIPWIEVIRHIWERSKR